jgi:hypothetical protein
MGVAVYAFNGFDARSVKVEDAIEKYTGPTEAGVVVNEYVRSLRDTNPNDPMLYGVNDAVEKAAKASLNVRDHVIVEFA